jgi:hypothetical protein
MSEDNTMHINSCRGAVAIVFAGILAATIMTSTVRAHADAASAIQRIKSGAHSSMPEPTTAPASGAEGEGMTIENGTGQTLYVYFSGPVNKTVKIASGTERSVSLVVGRYEVAGEIPGGNVRPFYGKQSYDANTHYWLKFYLR